MWQEGGGGPEREERDHIMRFKEIRACVYLIHFKEILAHHKNFEHYVCASRKNGH